MIPRLTPTLGICVIAAAVTGGLLFLPADDAPATTDAYGQPLVPVDGGSGDDISSEITIRDFDFGDPITVAAGVSITVTNADGVGHTLTAKNAEFDAGFLTGNEDASFTAPSEAGSYAFFCEVHPSMTGELIVQ